MARVNVEKGKQGFQPTTDGKTPPQSGPIMVGRTAMVPAEDSAMAAATRKMDAMHEAVGGEIQHKMRHRARKAFLVAAPIAIMIGSLTACGAPSADNTPAPSAETVVANENAEMPSIKVFKVKLDSGEVVQCIYGAKGYGGGMSCNWNGIPNPPVAK